MSYTLCWVHFFVNCTGSPTVRTYSWANWLIFLVVIRWTRPRGHTAFVRTGSINSVDAGQCQTPRQTTMSRMWMSAWDLQLSEDVDVANVRSTKYFTQMTGVSIQRLTGNSQWNTVTNVCTRSSTEKPRDGKHREIMERTKMLRRKELTLK